LRLKLRDARRTGGRWWAKLREVLSRREPRLLILGLVLTLLPPVLAARYLETEEPTLGQPSAVGFIPPSTAEPERGFALGMLVRVGKCNEDVDVTVVAAGTSEYWVDHRDLDPDASFWLALPGADADTVTVRLGATATDVTVPQDAPPKARSQPLKYTRRQAGDLAIVKGTVTRWTDTLKPVIAWYSADWLERRGPGSCFLRLPALTGEPGMVSAQIARRKAWAAKDSKKFPIRPYDVKIASRGMESVYDGTLEIAHASTIVVASTGDVDGGASLPSPDASSNGSASWTCRGRYKEVWSLDATDAHDSPDIVQGLQVTTTTAALSAATLRAQSGGNCSALAVVVESGAGFRRDVVLLAVGSIVSLGFAILVDLVRGLAKRRRRYLPPPGAGP
jgi:hypothetical protein